MKPETVTRLRRVFDLLYGVKMSSGGWTLSSYGYGNDQYQYIRVYRKFGNEDYTVLSIQRCKLNDFCHVDEGVFSEGDIRIGLAVMGEFYKIKSEMDLANKKEEKKEEVKEEIRVVPRIRIDSGSGEEKAS